MIPWIKKTVDQMPKSKEWILVWHTILGPMMGRYDSSRNTWRVHGKLGVVRGSNISHFAYITRPSREAEKSKEGETSSDVGEGD